jgi:hypothetical protein
MKTLTLTLAAITLGVTQAHAMTYRYTMDAYNHPIITAEGDIEVNELQNFLALKNDRHLSVLALNSNGGNVNGAVDLAKYIHQHNFSTVAIEGTCASACTIVWAAGNNKLAEPWVIGVHRASLISGEVVNNTNENNDSVSNMLANILATYNAPPNVIYAAKVTPPASLYLLTCDDLKAWNATIPYTNACFPTSLSSIEATESFLLPQPSPEPKSEPQPQPKPKPTSAETLKGHQLVSDYLAYCKKYPTDCKWDSKHKFSHLHGADID